VLDLDGFKGLNDRLGHDAGDRLLVDVARSLADDLDGTPYRTGGDEFCIVAPNARGDLAGEAERLVRAVAPDGVTASVGVAHLPGEADGLLAALKLADARMYAAKTARRVARHGARPAWGAEARVAEAGVAGA
jgi:diguanylate cyclase (GGDEF)-like protein